MRIHANLLGKRNQCQLMVWDTNQKTFNTPGLTTKVASKVEINQGDEIVLKQLDDGSLRLLQVDEVVHVKDYMSDYKFYYTLKTTRQTI